MRGSIKPIFLICLLGLYFASSGVIEINLRKNDNTQSQATLNSDGDSSNGNGKKYGLDMTFEEYKDKFGKVYATAKEQALRRVYFETNKKNLQTEQCDPCGVNIFTDKSPEQKLAFFGTFAQGGKADPQIKNLQSTVTSQNSIRISGALSAIPSSFDWRNYNVVTPPKNQGSCGSCWAFSAIGFLESELIRRSLADKTVDLSEQFLMQCDTSSYGCSGGFPFNATALGISTGLPRQATYPYNLNTIYSTMCASPTIAYTFSGIASSVVKYSPSTKASDATLISYLLQRPIMLGVNANDIQKYAPIATNQVLTCKSSNSKGGINHAVLLIGYTSNAWIIKNSWGTNWGLGGYIHVTRTSSYNCGIGLYYGSLSNTLPPV